MIAQQVFVISDNKISPEKALQSLQEKIAADPRTLRVVSIASPQGGGLAFKVMAVCDVV